jgi:hypothetical protein
MQPISSRCLGVALLSLAPWLTCGCQDVVAPPVVDPVYEEVCRYTDCSGSGVCTVGEASAPVCVCHVGYRAEDCSRCEPGFHRDALSRCVSDQRCADLAANPCGPNGFCSDDDGVIGCECDPGYGGPRCSLCAVGWVRGEEGDCLVTSFVPDSGAGDSASEDSSTHDAATTHGDCLQEMLEDFSDTTGFPVEINTCRSSPELQTTRMLFRSEHGEAAVSLCSETTFNSFATQHLELRASPTRAAEIQLARPATSVTFDYAARLQPLSLSVRGDDRGVTALDLEARSAATVTLTFDPPTRVISFLSRSPYAQSLSLDNVRATLEACP